MTDQLLVSGAVAGAAFVAVLLVEGPLRPGYDPIHHTGGELSLGDRGWIQIANFSQVGVGMLAYAVGVHRALDTVAGAVLLAVFGLALIAAGVFVVDPRRGYPPGAVSDNAGALPRPVHHQSDHAVPMEAHGPVSLQQEMGRSPDVTGSPSRDDRTQGPPVRGGTDTHRSDSMISTRFTDLVGCSAPIQQAGMAGVATPDLAAAVAAAGGLGMVAAVLVPPDVLAAMLDSIARPSDGAVGVNFLMPFLASTEAVEVAASRARVLEFFYGEPDEGLVDRVHDGGALAFWQVGSVREARAAVDAGCDAVVVQGTEAGGHVRGEVSLFPLLAQVLDRVEVPIVAAGGIATSRHVAAALAAGASAVRVGTRFVATAESGAHPDYIAALLRAGDGDSVLTDVFSVMWPDAPHRVLRSCITAAAASTGDLVGEERIGAEIMPIPRFAVPAPTRDTTGEIAAMALYAGESVGAVTSVVPAARVVRELVEGAERFLGRWNLAPA